MLFSVQPNVTFCINSCCFIWVAYLWFFFFFKSTVVYKKILHMAFPRLPIVNEVVLCGLSGLLLSWDLALG